ncbi:hypothetical protein GMORB2_1793 [Geosmithia morbida]|uniref:Terpene synthase n=1 Tax=Geosmithia morbida TaxID=1094350 RepID=A0A9P5CZT4_9HYPO|nr:uncharacterized protein GMORB2_1793 [Geosmithia morbida]KAF4121953.1 hypothetical protein GMORB2_1793 [Geosmithia morbida]
MSQTLVQSKKSVPKTSSLRHELHSSLKGHLDFDQAKLERLQAADFASFTALWWPDADLEKLEILSYLVIWLFTWDDEIDEPTGTYSEDFEEAQKYRERTLFFVGHCLGLSDGIKNSKPQNRIVQSFDVIGASLKASYTTSQCQRFYDEVAQFMNASEYEQSGRLNGHIFSLEEYWKFRLGTSAVYIGSAAGEYSASLCIPAGIMRSPPMQAIWDETNIMISITNDLLSLMKEMRLGCIDSVVPLTFMITRNIPQAISKTIEVLQQSKARFDAASKEVIEQQCGDDFLRQEVSEFIQVQRSNCVGNLVWR